LAIAKHVVESKPPERRTIALCDTVHSCVKILNLSQIKKNVNLYEMSRPIDEMASISHCEK
jgi:hypothetical protein